jgi:2-amino-4-hydroxy-6-hydroxymethyldihydropteridine diphosphokinase
MARIYISIGSNIERIRYIRAARAELTRYFHQVKCSSVYESEAVGFVGDPFYNLVATAETDKTVDEVVQILKLIEANHGRRQSAKKFSSRTLDLDLLLYDERVQTSGVRLPRDEIVHNAFVLWPLAELAPQRVHPLTGQTYLQMWDQFDKQKQRLWVVHFDW